MDEINQRIRELRKALGMSQEEFGKVLKISKSGVCDIESGRRKVSESHIILLKNYSDQNIQEEWLRYGTGEMFKPFSTILSEIDFGNDEFIKDFIEVYMSLDRPCKDAMKKIMYSMAEKYTNRKSGD